MFHLWWKENLLNHQKVSEYYEHDCLQNFHLLFISLLPALIVKNSPFLFGIYFIFLKKKKKILEQTWKSFNTKFGPQWKDQENIYYVRQVLALFSKLVALILSWNYVKGLRVTKVVKQIKFEWVWGRVRRKKLLPRKSFTKYMDFMWNSALREKFNFYLQKISASANNIFISGGRLSTSPYFYDVLTFSWYFLIL